jgi:hypothetical protein
VSHSASGGRTDPLAASVRARGPLRQPRSPAALARGSGTGQVRTTCWASGMRAHVSARSSNSRRAADSSSEACAIPPSSRFSVSKFLFRLNIAITVTTAGPPEVDRNSTGLFR